MDCFLGGFAFTFSVKYLKIYHFFWYWFYFLNTIVALWKYFLEFHHILLVLRTCSAVCMSVFLLLFSNCLWSVPSFSSSFLGGRMLRYVVALSLLALSWAQDCQVANINVMQNFDKTRVSWKILTTLLFKKNVLHNFWVVLFHCDFSLMCSSTRSMQGHGML